MDLACLPVGLTLRGFESPSHLSVGDSHAPTLGCIDFSPMFTGLQVPATFFVESLIGVKKAENRQGPCWIVLQKQKRPGPSPRPSTNSTPLKPTRLTH